MNKRFLALLMALCLLLTPVGTNAAEYIDPLESGITMDVPSDEGDILEEEILGEDDQLQEEETVTVESQGEIDLTLAVGDDASIEENPGASQNPEESQGGEIVQPGADAATGVDTQADTQPALEEASMLPNPDEGNVEPLPTDDDTVDTDSSETKTESPLDDAANLTSEEKEIPQEKTEGEKSPDESPAEGTTTPEDKQTQKGNTPDKPAQEEPGEDEPVQEKEDTPSAEGAEAESKETDLNQETASQEAGTGQEAKESGEADGEPAGEGKEASDGEKEESGEAEDSVDGEDPELAEAEEDPELEEPEEPPKIVLSTATLTLGKKESLRLYAADEDPEGGTLRWSIANKKIATINQTGLVKAKKVGVTVARVVNGKGVYADCTIVVKKAPTGIKASPKTIYVSVGDRAHINAWAKNGACSTFKYSSSKKKVAKVDKGGWVYGVKPGKATITVRSYNKKRTKVKVVVVAAPSYVGVSPVNRTLGLGQTFKLNTSVPKNTSASFTFSSSDDSVATVNASGVVTAVGLGEASITARSHNGKTASCAVTVKEAPTGIDVDLTDYECAVGDRRRATAVMDPLDSYADILWSSGNTKVVTVAADGTVTAVGKGETTVYARTYVPGMGDSFHVKVYAAPTSVSVGAASVDFLLGTTETLDFMATIPEYTRTTFSFASSDASVVSVETLDPENIGAIKEQEGFRLQAHKRGRATITVTTANGKKAQIAVRVLDPGIPEVIELAANVPTINIGGTHRLSLAILPATAESTADLKFSSSDTKVATVSADGTIKGEGMGTANITVVSNVNSEARLVVPIMVYTDGLVTSLPAWTTSQSAGNSAIQGNLLKIQALENSADWMVDSLRSGGTISQADANTRKAMISNAFKDYSFPWITPAKQAYWKKANSEGGAKDFKTGIVYYGMPYNSTSTGNRNYNVSKALSEKRWTSSGDYYTLNRSNLLNNSYVGNDCSSFVSAAIWGVYSSRRKDTTKDIDKITAYKTVGSYLSLRPGDLLCKSASHVVMFLYFANPAKTKVMVIENGGPWAGTNTIHCAIYDLSWFTARSYKVRRVATLG